MNEHEQEPAPDGKEEASASELGEPEHEPTEVDEGTRAQRSEQRPDLDERERRISTQRKPMGPAPVEGEDRPHAAAGEDLPEPSDEPPTEPSNP